MNKEERGRTKRVEGKGEGRMDSWTRGCRTERFMDYVDLYLENGLRISASALAGVGRATLDVTTEFVSNAHALQ